MGLTLVNPPTVEAVTLDMAKDHLRIPLSDTSDDEWLSTAITASRMMMEASRYPGLDICLMQQTWKMVLDSFPEDGLKWIEIPKRPITSVTSITYVDVFGTRTVWPSNQYLSDMIPVCGDGTGPTRIIPIQSGSAVGSWPNVNPGISLQVINAVEILFVAGYGTDPANVPPPLVISQLMLLGSLYEFREATGDVGDAGQMAKTPVTMPFTYDAITYMYRGAGFA